MERQIKLNEMFANFMGLDGQHEEWCGNNVLYFDNLMGEEQLRSYNPHECWSDLMPIVEKIARLNNSKENIGFRTFGMLSSETGNLMSRLDGYSLFAEENFITSVYNCCVEFLEANPELLKTS